MLTVSHTVSKQDVRRSEDALVDQGANGFAGGSDCVLIGKPADGWQVHITGVDNHQACNAPIATVGALAHSNKGPVICIFHKVAHAGRHQSILSPIQMEAHGVKVDEKHPDVGGLC